MEELLRKQEKALAEAQAKSKGLRTHSHSPASLLGIVKAVDRTTQAILLLAKVLNKLALEEWNRRGA